MKLDGVPVEPDVLDLPADDTRRARAAGRQAALPAPARGVTVHTGLLRLETEGDGQIVDLTEGVLAVVRQSGVTGGVVCVFVTGSTAAVTTMEFEPGGVADLRRRWSACCRRAATTSTTSSTPTTTPTRTCGRR